MNSSQGGGSKDTWVLAGERSFASARSPQRSTVVAHGPMPAVESAIDREIRQQQEQQQQAGPPC